MKIHLHKSISSLAVALLLLIPFPLLAGDDSHTTLIISDDYSPAWTQVHFEVPGSWATIILNDKAENITSISFAIRGKWFDVPKPCFDDIHNPVLETAKLWFWQGGAAFQFMTETFDENGNGQDEKDMTRVRFVVENGILVRREVIQQKNHIDTSQAVIDLSKGLKQSDIGADRCGTPTLYPKANTNN